MRKRILASILAICLLFTLIPATAIAAETEPVETGGILIGATGCLNDGDRAPTFSDDVFYKIVANEDDPGTYTLTFWSKNEDGVIPNYVTESNAVTADGKTGPCTPSWRVEAEEKEMYPNGYITVDGEKCAIPAQGTGDGKDQYVYCTENTAYYRVTPWNAYNKQITKVVFEKSIAAIGQNTLFNMEKLASVEVQNENCELSRNMVYYNGVVGSACDFRVASTAYQVDCVNSATNSTSGHKTKYIITDAEAFMETYSALLDLDADSLTEDEKADIQKAYQTYESGNVVFQNAVDNAASGFGETLKTLYTAASGTNPDEVIVSGAVLDSSVQYELKSLDGGETYTLRFYDNGTGNGVMPDFVVDDANKDTNEKHYGNAPWYQASYRNKITHVIYDESITRTGYLTAAHLYNCELFEFLNPAVEIVDTTIHYNDNIQTGAVTVRCAAAAAKSSMIYFNPRYEGNSEKVSFSYFEAENFKETYADFFAKDNTSINEDEAQAVKAAFGALPTVCRNQLGTDLIPGTEITYVQKLNQLADLGLIEEYDETEVLSGVVPHAENDGVTVRYQIKKTEDGKYTLRFYDPDGDGKIPDYAVRMSGTNQQPDAWDAYEKLPWRVSPYGANIKEIIFEESITCIGRYAATNMQGYTDLWIKCPSAQMDNSAIYFRNDAYINDAGVTIHAYSTSGVRYLCHDEVTKKDLIKTSYIEAEEFEADTAYADLWTLDNENAASQSTLIQQAYREYSVFDNAVKEQLETDTIGETETTYAVKLNQLMAALNLGGNVDNISYVLTLNEDGVTHTLTVSGTGTIPAGISWASNGEVITNVVIASGVEGIAAGAFSGLTQLKTVDMAQSVETIEGGAFPNTDFELYGWLNHASGRYADANTNVQLKLKELRILNMGNSHTVDYTQFLDNILKDISGSVTTKITYQKLVPMGGRGLYIEQSNRSSHYVAAHSADEATRKPYDDAFAKTWDIVVVQDYHESTRIDGGANFADEMQEVVKWLHEAAKGAKIAWFADWAEKSANGADKLDQSYQQSVDAMEAVNALTENKPDFIIPASTVLQNARTSYLGTTRNAADALINWTGAFEDFAKGQLQAYTLLERDATHMSLELGRQLMASAFLYNIFQQYADEMCTDTGFDFFGCLETEPVYKSGSCEWQGEFVHELWEIIREACENAWKEPDTVTKCSEQYETDPFTAKYEQVKTILKAVTVPETLSQESLEAAFKADAVVNALAEIEGLNITADSVKVTYTAPVDGTEEVPTGKDGGYTVEVDCHYGYSYPTAAALEEKIPAKPHTAGEEALAALKTASIAKLNSYMSDDSYEGSAKEAVQKAKEEGAAAINAATSESGVTDALSKAKAAIDDVETIFASQHIPDANCVDMGQIWTGGWSYHTAYINKGSYTMDTDGTETVYESVFTGVWWVLTQDGNGGYVLEFFKDPGTGYSFETPAYNSNHWLDPRFHQQPSTNPLQYNQTPWMMKGRTLISKAIVDSGVTINQYALACYPNIKEYVIEDGAALGTNAIYFNPLMTDTKVTFEGSAVVQKNAFSSHRVENSYGYYVDVVGDMSEVHIGSAESTNTLETDLYQAFGKYQAAKVWNAEAQADDDVWIGLAGTDVTKPEDFAPHYTNGVPDGTTMLRVTNTNTEHMHTLVKLDAKEAHLCETGLTEGSVCSDCGAVVVAQEVIPGSGEHTWDSGKVTTEATNMEKGLITYTCQVCGATKTELIDRLLNADPAAAMGGKNYATLQDAINAAGQNAANIHLLRDVTESITIKDGQAIILDLNGMKLTDNGSDTISNYGSLTVADSAKTGTVDNVTHGKGALVNYPSGTVILDGGKFTRSAECPAADSQAKNSWYTLKNMGEVTINAGVTVTTGSNSVGASSLIANGWYNGNANPNNSSVDRNTTHTGDEVAKLTINGGTFSGGMNTVKNDDWGVLVINNGSFENTTGPIILNWNEATVNNGTFKAVNGAVVANGYGNDTSDKGLLTINGGIFTSGNGGTSPLFAVGESAVTGGKLAITGGDFTGKVSGAAYAAYYDVDISAGTFSTKVPDAYCADTFVPTNADTNGKYTVDHARTITLKYQDNNTTADKTITVADGETAELPAPSLANYRFDGWWDAPSGGKQYTSSTPISADVTLYARWTYIGGSSGGSSSGSSSSSTYPITVDSGKHGDVTTSTKNAKQGATVTITVKPDDGYELDDLTVTDKNGKTVKVTEGKNGKFTFTMPASKVTVEATFAKTEETREHRFVDVPDGHWAEDEIAWAYENGYMNGNTATTFNPNGTVTRQQLWMILARLSGYQPADFAEAKAWAVDNSISDGTNPGNAVSRQQLVTILYRYAVKMGYKTTGTADLTVFPDHASVAAYAKDAMSWSVANSIVGGTAQGTLDPNGTATRAQFAVILYRFCENIVK